MTAVVRTRSGRMWCLVGTIGVGSLAGPLGAGFGGATQIAQSAQVAQPPATQTPPQPAGTEERVFAAEAGLIFNPIKPGSTADFEMVLTRLREALQASPNPTRREQAKGWRVFKAQEPFQGNVLYIFVVDPAVKGADYSVTRILAEAFPTEVQSLYEKFSGAFAGRQSLVNLSLVQAYGQTPAGVKEVLIGTPRR